MSTIFDCMTGPKSSSPVYIVHFVRVYDTSLGLNAAFEYEQTLLKNMLHAIETLL